MWHKEQVKELKINLSRPSFPCCCVVRKGISGEGIGWGRSDGQGGQHTQPAVVLDVAAKLHNIKGWWENWGRNTFRLWGARPPVSGQRNSKMRTCSWWILAVLGTGVHWSWPLESICLSLTTLLCFPLEQIPPSHLVWSYLDYKSPVN